MLLVQLLQKMTIRIDNSANVDYSNRSSGFVCHVFSDLCTGPVQPRVRLGFLSLLLSQPSGLSFAELSTLCDRTGYTPRFLSRTISYLLRIALAGTWVLSTPR